MKPYEAKDIRNVVVAGHLGTGKTSLVEVALFDTDAKDRIGRVEEGTTTTDFEPAEAKRHISISAALAPVEWQNCKINFVDTPGYADFIGEVEGAMAVGDAALLLVNGASGLEVGTEHAWQMARRRGLATVVFVNKMDRENADFNKVLTGLRQRFGPKVVPLQIPIGAEAGFSGVVDLVHQKAVTWNGKQAIVGPVPANLQEEMARCRETLIEVAAENDDELISKYLDGGTLTDDEVIRGLRLGVRNAALFPVLCGSAARNIGVSSLLDVLVFECPSPADEGPVMGARPGGTGEEARQPSDQAPLALRIFKTAADPYVGKLTYFRVMSGVLRSDSHLWNPAREHEERLGQIYAMHGKRQEGVPEIHAGDLGAVAKLTSTGTGDTLCDKAHPIIFPMLEFPRPVYSVAIVAKTKADEDKLGPALGRLADEDRTFEFHRVAETGQTVISGLGETHIGVMVDALKSKFGVEVVIHEVRVPYRETITGTARVQGRHKKQTGGRGQFGDCWIEMSPLPRGGGYAYVDRIVGGSIPRQFIPAVDKGIQEAMVHGVLAGYPTVDIQVACVDGSYHAVDSSEQAFKTAGHQAFRAAVEKCAPVILEPIVNAEIEIPEEFMGDVISDLNAKRGRVQGMEQAISGQQIVRAQVPQAEMVRYAIDLRSITRGRGTFRIEPSHYEEVPAHVAQQIVEQARKEKEE